MPIANGNSKQRKEVLQPGDDIIAFHVDGTRYSLESSNYSVSKDLLYQVTQRYIAVGGEYWLEVLRHQESDCPGGLPSPRLRFFALTFIDSSAGGSKSWNRRQPQADTQHSRQDPGVEGAPGIPSPGYTRLQSPYRLQAPFPNPLTAVDHHVSYGSCVELQRGR